MKVWISTISPVSTRPAREGMLGEGVVGEMVMCDSW